MCFPGKRCAPLSLAQCASAKFVLVGMFVCMFACYVHAHTYACEDVHRYITHFLSACAIFGLPIIAPADCAILGCPLLECIRDFAICLCLFCQAAPAKLANGFDVILASDVLYQERLVPAVLAAAGNLPQNPYASGSIANMS